ncbi:helix-hairpin-helix domain-containing protein [Desulfocastanea catecholica]
MKNPDRQIVTDLTDLPNVGRAIARDLGLVGIQNPKDLIGKNAYQLHDELCRATEKRHDPCVIDVFLAVIDFMEGGDPVPWWEFTAERKRHTTGDHERK